jgi:hypothetical protein
MNWLNLKRYVLILFLILPLHLFSFKYTLSVCAIFKNEARFLKEWIEYHRLIGVEHFWLYNNNSEDPYEAVLNPYINEGIVDLIEWPSQIKKNDYYDHTYRSQKGAYDHCLGLSRGVSKWVAFIDIDEFIVPKASDNLAQILEERYSHVSGLCVNWQVFGTSHIEELKENELVTEKLVLKGDASLWKNKVPKTILQPLHTLDNDDPHHFNYLENHWAVDTNYKRVNKKGGTKSSLLNIVQINHYWTRDEKFLRNEKCARYEMWGTSKGVLEEAAQLNKVRDLSIQRFVPRLKERMFASQDNHPVPGSPQG